MCPADTNKKRQSVDCLLCFGARNGTGSRSAELGPSADLTVPRTVIQHRSRFKSHFFIYQNKKTIRLDGSFFWCEKRDLNPYGCPHAPQTCASADSATLAYRFFRTLLSYYSKCLCLCQYLFQNFFNFFQYI